MKLISGNTKTQRKRHGGEEIVAIDIGTYMLRILVGTVQKDGNVNVTHYSETLSDGMIAGTISNLNELANKIALLIQNYLSSAEARLDSCVLGIAGRFIHSGNSHGNTLIVGETVSPVDKIKAIDNACGVRFIEGDQLIHAIPRDFTVNGQPGITDPVGLSAPRIDVSVHLISASIDQEKNFRRALAKVSEHAQVDAFIYNGIAAADSVLTESEKEIGVCVIDLGEGTVNVAIYDRKQLIISFGLAHCGDRIRREIAQSFGLSLEIAEQLKQKVVSLAENIAPEALNQSVLALDAQSMGSSDLMPPNEIIIGDVIKIIEDNLGDTFRSVRDKIEEIVNQDMELSSLNLGAGYVLTGGMSSLPYIDNIASRYLSTAVNANPIVRVGRPRGVTSADGDAELEAALSCPDKAVVVGLLRHTGLAIYENQSVTETLQTKKDSFLSRIFNWWNSEF